MRIAPNKYIYFIFFADLNKKLINKKFKLLFISGLILLNFSLYISSEYLSIPKNRIKRRNDAVGFEYDKAKHFLYFYYYKGLFPLASLEKEKTFSKEGADYQIKEKGKKLIMEYKHWSRMGENARIFAFLPNAYLNGSPKNPSIKLFNAIIFVLGLIICFSRFHSVKLPLFGAILTILINLTPYYIYEVYFNQNIFHLLTSVLLIVIGINIKLLFNESISRWIFIIAIITGITISFFTEIRGEVSIILVSAFLIYIFSRSIKFVSKLFLIILLMGPFFITKHTIRTYFNYKFNATYKLVEKYGGHPYTGNSIMSHSIWLPVFCGLGDFDNKYGYEWNDTLAFSYATPILQKKYNYNIKYSGKYHLDNYYDEDHLYYIKFEEIPEFEEIIKDKVLNDIKSDPFWYLSILYKRILKILTRTLPFRYIVWILFPILFFLYKKRYWNFIKLFVVSLPLSINALIFYSNSCYNSIYPYILLTIFIYFLIKDGIILSSKWL